MADISSLIFYPVNDTVDEYLYVCKEQLRGFEQIRQKYIIYR